MTLRITWSPRAESGLDEALAYIALDNPGAALGLLDRVLAAVDRASRFPRSGRPIPEVPENSARELAVPPLRIFYETDAKELQVLGVQRSERHFDPGSLA